MSELPKILLDFASAPSLQDWEVEDDSDCLTLEYDATLDKRVLVKKGREFDPGVTYKRQGAPPLDWSYLHYELAVRLHPESFIYINVLDKTGKNRTLLYSSAILPGLNQWEEFMIPLDKEVSDRNWHSLMIDLPEHMEQARWPSFVRVNWLRLRGAVTLAGIRGCDDKDPLIESAIASPYVVHSPAPRTKGEWVYDFFDYFEEADSSDYREKPNCVILPDGRLISGGVAKRGIFQHPPLPGHGPSRLLYPPIRIPDHIQELRLDFFIGILNERPDTGEQQDKFSKGPFKGDAVKFRVRVNGKSKLDKRLNSVGWVPYSLPIELPTDGELIVEFITDAMGDLTFNWAAWGEPRLLGVRAVQVTSEDSAITPSLLGTGNRWAVLVGVNEYEDKANYGQLHVCVKDLEAIRGQLIAGGFDPARIRLLTDDKSELPTRENILVALKSIADATEPDDLLLFYYSGHGDEDGGEGYLVARNGRRLVLRDTAVPISRVKEIMEQASARAKVIILDACHSGADIGGKGPKPMSAEFIRRVFQQAEGLAILSSCKQGQLSYEWRENERSVFTYFLLEAFTGEADRDEKGFVTVQDANRHVTNGVKLWASQRNRSQTPTLQYTVAGDIILIRNLGSE